MAKRILFSFLFLFTILYNVKSTEAFYPEAVFFSQNDETYFLHKIERGQTVYSIARMYSITTDDIYRLNPGSEEGIRADDTLRIPQESGSYIYHTIQAGENIYALSKRYFMKPEDITEANPGLSVKTFIIGRIIRIPTNLVTEPIQGGNEILNQQQANSILSRIDPIEKISKLNIALLLPFGTKERTNPQNASQNQFVEYYEGFLLALRDMEPKLLRNGIAVNLEVFDIGSQTNDLMNLIQTNTLQGMDLLIGGLYDKQIKAISQYSKENAIPYVIPVTSTSDAVMDNSMAFQINTPQSYLYSKASLAFINRYKNDNVIIVKDPASANKMDFIQQLEDDLKQNAIPYFFLEYDETFETKFLSVLDAERNNVFIPVDDTAETLSKLINSLKIQMNTTPDLRLSLFGYPQWQTYAADLSEDFFRFSTTFYSFFYANPTSSNLKEFYNTFYYWYSRDLLNRFPKYGILGYDTGRFFIELFSTYGKNFESYINDLPFKGIQTDFKFERINNWSGFINTNLYLVEFEPSYMISKTDIR